MLGRMIAGKNARSTASPPSQADDVVTTQAEWNAVFANSAAVLSGKTLEVAAAITQEVVIQNEDIAPLAAPLTIRSANPSASLARLRLAGTVTGIDFSGLNFQMTGWPSTWPACVHFATGTYSKLRFINGTSFRHGYGPGLVNFDTSAELPEYERRNHIQTATTTSATYPISWRLPNASSGTIEFFNRGAQTVYAAFGGAGVFATATSTACPPNARTRFSINPTTNTHFAILAAAGTSQVNARAEQGLGIELARAFFREGAGNIQDIEIRNCFFSNLMTGAVLGSVNNFVFMDNDFDRIYSDVMAATPRAGGKGRVMRNIVSVQFCRSGIPEDNDGDAQDPHGDVFQMFGSGSGTVRDVIIAGNRMRARNLRPNVTNQGFFISDNNIVPAYSDIYMVSNTLIGGSVGQIASGEGTVWPIANYLVYGATVVNYANPASTNQRIDLATLDGGSVYVGSAIAPNFSEFGEVFMKDRTVALNTPGALASTIFPNISGVLTANTRSEIDTALTTAGAGAGIGAIATSNAIDWTTSNPEAVVLWDNVPSGAHWLTKTHQPIDTLVTLPLRKILNPRPAQTVSVGQATQWRKVAADGTTELLAWTSAPGTIEPGQFIQIRRQTANVGATVVQASVTINGFAQVVDLVTTDAPTAYLIQGATAGFFLDPANPPAGTTRMTFRGKFWFPASGWSSCKPFSQVSTGCDLTIFPTGVSTITVEDGIGTKMLSNTAATSTGGIPMAQWVTLVFDVDMANQTAVLILNGTTFTVPFTASGNGVFQTGNKVSFLAVSNGTLPVPVGTLVADLSVDFNGALRKSIPNDAASANADAWKQGGAFTSVP